MSGGASDEGGRERVEGGGGGEWRGKGRVALNDHNNGRTTDTSGRVKRVQHLLSSSYWVSDDSLRFLMLYGAAETKAGSSSGGLVYGAFE